MTRCRGIVAFAVAALFCAGCRTHDLGGRPIFRANDAVRIEAARRTVWTSASTDGQTVSNLIEKARFVLTQHVTAADGHGRPRELLVEAEGLRRDSASTAPRATAFGERVEAPRVLVTARRGAGAFEPDTATLRGDLPALTLPQLNLIKDVLLRPQRFAAYPEDLAALLPTGPVRVGKSWTPSEDALRQWRRRSPMARRLRPEVKSARFRLAAAGDDAVRVAGTMKMVVRSAGRNSEMTWDVAALIDAATGVWLDQQSDIRMTGAAGGLAVTVEDSLHTRVRFSRPAEGDEPALPEAPHDLGWAPPGPDDNRYHGPAAGVSLDVPAAFTQADAGRGPVLAKFDAPGDRHLTISIRSKHRPMTRAELTRFVAGGLSRALDGFQMAEREELVLPGNVPAVMLSARCLQGGRPVAVVALAAVDGRRIVGVTALAPAGEGQAERLRGIVRTLRVFEPTETPPQPVAEP